MRAVASEGKNRKMGKSNFIVGTLLLRGKNGKWEKKKPKDYLTKTQRLQNVRTQQTNNPAIFHEYTNNQSSTIVNPSPSPAKPPFYNFYNFLQLSLLTATPLSIAQGSSDTEQSLQYHQV